MIAPWILALTLLLIALAAIPTRQLFAAGIRSGWLVSYLLFLVALGFVVATGRGPSKILVPVLVVAFVAPFVLAPGVLRRMLRRIRAVEPRNVGSGAGRTVRPDGTLDPEEPPDEGKPR